MAAGLPNPDVLGKSPDEAELLRLVENYPSYKWEHRNALLRGYFQGHALEQLLEDKLRAKNIDPASCGGRSIGGHTRWVCEKVERTFMRILYLRHRLDDGLTRTKAHQRLIKQFGSDKAKDAGQSAIRKATAGAKVDKKI